MDAFESVVCMLLRHKGFWTHPSFKVELTKEEKRQIGRHSSPRWELDILAYNVIANEVIVVECKSFLDSTGVLFRDDQFAIKKRFKLFTDEILWQTVKARLTAQLVSLGACQPAPKVTLCLAVGKIANRTDLAGLTDHFKRKGWWLIEPGWIKEQLTNASARGYENDIAFVVSKLLLRTRRSE